MESLRIIRQWQGLVLMQAGYLGIWLALAGVNYAVLRALEIRAPVAAAFLVLIVLQVGTSVPSTPGKIGIFQYLAVLAPFGVAREPALTYGVLLHVVGFGLRETADFGALADMDTVNICLPTPLRKTKDPDLSYIVATVDEIARHPHPDMRR